MKKMVWASVGCVIAAASVPAGAAQAHQHAEAENPYVTYIGNTFPGGGWSPGPNQVDHKWMQYFVDQMVVDKDGTCYASAHWDEAHRNYGVYRDGDVIGNINKGINARSVVDKWGRKWTIEGHVWPKGWMEGRQVVCDKGMVIDDVRMPTAVAIANDGMLMVADDGKGRHNIRFYDISGNIPVYIKSFGAEGGICSGVSGEVEPLKFWGITGCGMDSQGNIYVAISQEGSAIRSFTPDGTLRWELTAWHFEDCLDVDPLTDGADVYGVQEHYSMDYSRSRGKEATLVGYTIDTDRFPYDPRAHFLSDRRTTSVNMKRFNNRLYLFTQGQTAVHFVVMRKEIGSEVFLPSTIFSRMHCRQDAQYQWPGLPDVTKFPPNQPPCVTGNVWSSGADWIWNDKNGNALFDDGEYQTSHGRGKGSQGGCGWYVDNEGTVWQNTKKEGWSSVDQGDIIRKFPLQGIDANGNLVYNFDSCIVEGMPAPFSMIQRLVYIAETDVMYIGGYTPSDNKGSEWGCVGKIIVRYDNWSKPSRSIHPGFPLKLEYQYTGSWPCKLAKSMWVAGDYIFVAYFLGTGRGLCKIYNANSAEFVADWEPATQGKFDGPVWGCDHDMFYSVNAYKRIGGEYLVFLSEHCWNKVLLYRWNPPGPPACHRPVIEPSTGFYNKAQQVHIRCTTPGAEIRYTTDGAIPTSASALYSGPLTIEKTTTLKAVAFKAGLAQSDIAAAWYRIDPSYVVIGEQPPSWDSRGGRWSAHQGRQSAALKMIDPAGRVVCLVPMPAAAGATVQMRPADGMSPGVYLLIGGGMRMRILVHH